MLLGTSKLGLLNSLLSKTKLNSELSLNTHSEMHITGISVYAWLGMALFANLLDGKMKIKEIVHKLSIVRR